MTDLDELERLARGTDGGLGDDDPWPTAGDIAGGFSWNRLEATYIAAASPDVVLGLIARVRAAEGTVTLLSDEIRRKGLTSGSAMAAHLAVELDTSDVPCLGDYQCRRQTVSPSAPACLACIDRHREATKP